MESGPQDSETNDEPEVISLDDIDSILNDESPGLQEEMSSIAEAGKDIDPAEIPDEPAEQNDLIEEDIKPTFITKLLENKKFNKFLKFLNIILMPARVMANKFSSTWIRLRNFILLQTQRFISFLKDDFPIQLKKFQQAAVDWVKYLIARTKNLKNLSKFKKFLLVILLFGFGTLIALLQMNLSGRWIPDFSESLLSSFKDHADHIESFSEKEDLVSFYDSFPQPDHTVLIENIVVSLKRVRGSRAPFASAELFINLDSKDTAIEVKRREKEFLDIIQRELEEYTYEEVNSVNSLNRIKEDIKNTLNVYINRGRVKNIYFKTLISNP